MEPERRDALVTTALISAFAGTYAVWLGLAPRLPQWLAFSVAVASGGPFGLAGAVLGMLWHRSRGDRFPPAVEVALYFFALEGLGFVAAILMAFSIRKEAGLLAVVPLGVCAAGCFALVPRLEKLVEQRTAREQASAREAQLFARARDEAVRRERERAAAIELRAELSQRLPAARRALFAATDAEVRLSAMHAIGLPADLLELTAWAALSEDLELYRAAARCHHQHLLGRGLDRAPGPPITAAQTTGALHRDVERLPESLAPLARAPVAEALARLELLAEARRASDLAAAQAREARKQALSAWVEAVDERQRQEAEELRRRQEAERVRVRDSLQLLVTPAAERAGEWAKERWRRETAPRPALRLVKEHG